MTDSTPTTATNVATSSWLKPITYRNRHMAYLIISMHVTCILIYNNYRVSEQFLNGTSAQNRPFSAIHGQNKLKAFNI